jgi:hypothetical protein
MRTEDYKLMRNPGPVKGAPDTVDGRVLIHIATDPKEDVNAFSDAPDVGRRMEGALREWFEDMRDELHSFYTPSFAVGPGTTNVVWLYAPERVRGNVTNGTLAIDGWRAPGDGADYRIEVMESGRYTVTLHCREFTGDSVTLALRIGGRELEVQVTADGETAVGVVDLPEGRLALRLDVCGTSPAGEAKVGGVTALRFDVS